MDREREADDIEFCKRCGKMANYCSCIKRFINKIIAYAKGI